MVEQKFLEQFIFLESTYGATTKYLFVRISIRVADRVNTQHKILDGGSECLNPASTVASNPSFPLGQVERPRTHQPNYRNPDAHAVPLPMRKHIFR